MSRSPPSHPSVAATPSNNSTPAAAAASSAVNFPILSRVSAYLSQHSTTIAYATPAVILLLLFLQRRVAATRKQLFADRPTSFWVNSMSPPHTAPAAALAFTSFTQTLYTFLPLSWQHSARDTGLLRLWVNCATFLGGALVFAWRPRVVRRFFLHAPGRLCDVRYGEMPQQVLDIFATHRVEPSTAPAAATPGNDSTAVAAATVSSNTKPLSPVMIFLHGGAWGSGNKETYKLFMQQWDEQLGFACFVVGYNVYPTADAEAQMADLQQAMEWVHHNAKQYGGDSSQIYLSGHSSGAHISSLLLLRQLSQEGRLRVPIRGFIGLAGVYDIADHYDFEAARGVHEISPMQPACGGRSQFHKYSCTGAALRLTPEQRAQLPPFLLLHGQCDHTVPYSSSVRMAYALSGGGFENKAIRELEPLDSHSLYHASPSDPMMTIRNLTFTNDQAPVVHLRMCGAKKDPVECDHATFILDLINCTSSRDPKTNARITHHVGHSQWLMQAVDRFRNDIVQRDRQRLQQEVSKATTTIESGNGEPSAIKSLL